MLPGTDADMNKSTSKVQMNSQNEITEQRRMNREMTLWVKTLTLQEKKTCTAPLMIPFRGRQQ